jgi:hypothetical protein
MQRGGSTGIGSGKDFYSAFIFVQLFLIVTLAEREGWNLDIGIDITTMAQEVLVG